MSGAEPGGTEYRIIGPPGSGKTTTIARQARRAAHKFGADKVVICSLTRAAAAEASGRDTAVVPANIGTLHALCYRGLGHPRIVDKDAAKEWNDRFPQWSIGVPSGDVDDVRTATDDGSARGRSVLEEIDVLRSRMTPIDRWPVHLATIYAAWCAFKEELDVMDFTDLIEHAHHALPWAPGNPAVIFGDEVQDWSRLEVDLVRRWSRHAEYLVLCGDPLQALYAWRGADKDILSIEGFPEDHIRVPREEDDVGSVGHRSWRDAPPRSHRVPAVTHALARKIVRGLPGSEVDFIPTEMEGAINRISATYKRPEMLGDLLGKLDGQGSVMLLATCEYVLQPTERWLRQQGIPYHNPYSTRWNPLRSTWKRIADYLAPASRLEAGYAALKLAEIQAWGGLLRADGVFLRGGKTLLKEATPDSDLRELLPRVFTEDAFERLWDGDLGWFLANSDPSRGVAYPAAILKRLGVERLSAAMMTPPRDRPFIVLSTVHSTKGAEADHVILFPDIPRSAWEASRRPGWEGEQALRRLFYVAVTRARRSLYVATPDSPNFVRL